MAVDVSVAEVEFDRFCDAMGLDVDPVFMNEEDRANLTKHRAVIVDSIRDGKVVISEAGEPIFSPSDDSDPLTFYEPTGATFLAMDSRKKGHDVAKMNAMLSDMTKTDPGRFSKMRNRDYKICQSLITVFLG